MIWYVGYSKAKEWTPTPELRKKKKVMKKAKSKKIHEESNQLIKKK